MLKIVTAQQMREIDRKTIEEVGIPGLLLMENAGLGVVQIIEEILEDISQPKVLLFCGKGNNGGDGFVIARHLFNHGFDIHIFLTGPKEEMKGDALINLEILQGFGIEVLEIKEKKNLLKIPLGDLIVDALLGTGIKGEVTGFLADVIAWINQSQIPVVAVDLPSGLQSDDGQYVGQCIKANHTGTMAELKRGLMLPPGREMSGDITVIDIGSPDLVAESVSIKTFFIEESDIIDRLPPRPAHAHKGDFGKVAILAGSPGLTGAATLSSKASLAVGCGLTILGTPQNLNPVLEEKLTEVMTKPLPQTSAGTLSKLGLEDIHELLKWAEVLAIGPGLSVELETAELTRQICMETDLPTVIDADGLNSFESYSDLFLKMKAPRILTPHYGELARLIKMPIQDIAKNCIEAARETAEKWGITLVLKGAPTVIADSEGMVCINSTGNSGMATAGTGDVLTGMIAGFLGQGCSPFDAALCGVYCHGLAGDLAALEMGDRSLIAGDLIEFLPEVFAYLEEDA